MRIRTKICGITRIEDALNAVDCGADAIGLVFFKQSPRYIDIKTAQEICLVLPPFVTVVGLFVNESHEAIENICTSVPLNLLQFHGDESESDCDKYDLPYIKAIRIRSKMDVYTAEDEFPSAQALLVDTYKKGVPGGTGERFDWSLLPDISGNKMKKPLILAGGLTPENIHEAIRTVQPYAVDVSGGVESGKGIKDHEKVSLFVKGVLCGC